MDCNHILRLRFIKPKYSWAFLNMFKLQIRARILRSLMRIYCWITYPASSVQAISTAVTTRPEFCSAQPVVQNFWISVNILKLQSNATMSSVWPIICYYVLQLNCMSYSWAVGWRNFSFPMVGVDGFFSFRYGSLNFFLCFINNETLCLFCTWHCYDINCFWVFKNILC